MVQYRKNAWHCCLCTHRCHIADVWPLTTWMFTCTTFLYFNICKKWIRTMTQSAFPVLQTQTHCRDEYSGFRKYSDHITVCTHLCYGFNLMWIGMPFLLVGLHSKSHNNEVKTFTFFLQIYDFFIVSCFWLFFSLASVSLSLFFYLFQSGIKISGQPHDVHLKDKATAGEHSRHHFEELCRRGQVLLINS